MSAIHENQKSEYADVVSEVTTEPKKRGRKPKAKVESSSEVATEPKKENAAEETSTTRQRNPKANDHPINGGNWSSTQPQVPMYYMTVEVEFLEKALGTSPSNEELLREFIASKAPDAPSREQEIAAIGESEAFDKTINIYPKGDFEYDPVTDRYIDMLDKNLEPLSEEVKGRLIHATKTPYLYNYQLRGFFKDSCGFMSRADETDASGKKLGLTESAKLKAYRKVIDGCIFVFPRRIAIKVPEFYLDDDGVTMRPSCTDNGELPILQRPIRIQSPTGERVAIAASEMIPAGSRMKFTIGFTSMKFKPAIIEWLNYAAVHGISGWRNSGLGICRWREIKSDYTPYD